MLLAGAFGAGPWSGVAARAQVGLIIMAKEPEEARRLASRAKAYQARVRRVLARGPLSPAAGQKVRDTASAWLAEARRILADSRTGAGMSLSEKEALERDLRTVRDVCRWLDARSSPSPRTPAALRSTIASPSITAPSPARSGGPVLPASPRR
jgi:hypothetical protein